MSLALKLGRTVAELGASLSSAEFSLWLALYRDAPWDDRRADLHAGIIASTIANYAGKMRPDGSVAATPIDYMPFSPKPKPPEEDPDPTEHFKQLS